MFFSNGTILMVTLLVCLYTSLDLNCTEASLSLFQLLSCAGMMTEWRMCMVDRLVRSDGYCLHSSHLRFDQILLQICPSFDCHDCCLIYYVISEYKVDQLIRLDWLNWNAIQISMCILYIVFLDFHWRGRQWVNFVFFFLRTGFLSGIARIFFS